MYTFCRIHIVVYIHYTMVTSSENVDSEKVKVIIGKLIEKAEQSVRPVISVFDNSQSRAVITKRFDKFSLPILESCAEFLGIALADKDGYKLFTKKSLMDRIYCGLNALMPDRCSECNVEYVIDHVPEVEPFFSCFKCFKGSHSCERNILLHQALSALNTPSGFVWLCNTCYSAVDPTEPRKSRSRHMSGSGDKSGEIGVEVSDIISPGTGGDVMSSTQKPQQHSVSFPEMSEFRDESSDGSHDSVRVCQKFLNWDCPHGISGKKVVGGRCCPFKHPRVCNQYRISGFTGKKGCQKGKNCDFFHPDICKGALERGSCVKKDCSKFHPVSCRRNKESTRDKKQRPNKRNSSAPSSSKDFLELRDLVTGMATKLAALEKKLDQSAPSAPPALPQSVPQPAGQMFYPSHPQSAHPMMSLGVHRLPQHQIPFSHPSYFSTLEA